MKRGLKRRLKIFNTICKMKTEEVTAGNVTLAEFMGENEAHASIGFIYPRDECFPLSGRKFKESAIEDEVAREVEEFGETLNVTTSNYNDDWNLLMPVVEKIESFEDENRCPKFNVQIEQCFCVITDRSDCDIIMEINRDSKIEAVFVACVGFAKWYKNQPK